jgi:hypothetical protein
VISRSARQQDADRETLGNKFDAVFGVRPAEHDLKVLVNGPGLDE